MTKHDDIQRERERLMALFDGADPDKLELAKGLIEEAAFLAVENSGLRSIMVETGMVKIHPVHKEIQKPVECARQYRQNVNSYAVMIKAINAILGKDGDAGEDPFDEWLREKRNKDRPETE